jgi:hypothetical protein
MHAHRWKNRRIKNGKHIWIIKKKKKNHSLIISIGHQYGQSNSIHNKRLKIRRWHLQFFFRPEIYSLERKWEKYDYSSITWDVVCKIIENKIYFTCSNDTVHFEHSAFFFFFFSSLLFGSFTRSRWTSMKPDRSEMLGYSCL